MYYTANIYIFFHMFFIYFSHIFSYLITEFSILECFCIEIVNLGTGDQKIFGIINKRGV